MGDVPSFRVGEPIPFSLVLTNEGNEPVKCLPPGWECVWFFWRARRDDGNVGFDESAFLAHLDGGDVNMAELIERNSQARESMPKAKVMRISQELADARKNAILLGPKESLAGMLTIDQKWEGFWGRPGNAVYLDRPGIYWLEGRYVNLGAREHGLASNTVEVHLTGPAPPVDPNDEDDWLPTP